MDLFEYVREKNLEKEAPWRSSSDDAGKEGIGTAAYIGKDKLYIAGLWADKLSSIIFYGPPGTGKTTLAK